MANFGDGRKQRSKKITKFENQKVKFWASQSAKASNNQGGNSIAINAIEFGTVRIRAGQQGQ